MESKEETTRDIINEIIELTEEHIKLIKKAKRSIEYIQECYRCGFCCLNKEILVTIPEVIIILNKLPYKVDEIFNINKNKYTISIKTKEIDGAPYCWFLWKIGAKTECSIYNFRPFQCLTYPVIFHPSVKEFSVYGGKFFSYYAFECQGIGLKLCTALVKKSTFKKITEKRLKFLEKNYVLQKELIEKGLLSDVLMKTIKNIKTLDIDLSLD